MPSRIRASFPCALLAAGAVHAESSCRLLRLAELPVTMDHGRAFVTGTVNGKNALFIADSGAFFSLMTLEAARDLQVRLVPLPAPMQINGMTGNADARLGVASSFRLQGLNRDFTGAEFIVTGNDLAGEAAGVVGQNILGFFDTEYDLARATINLIRAEDCRNSMLAYWQHDNQVSVVPIETMSRERPHIIGKATLNGISIDVLFDTGTTRSMLDLRAARRAGIKLDGPDVEPAGAISGLGGRATESWIARFDELNIGGEIIRNARLRVADIDLGVGADMVLGTDFFMSHRLYIAKSQRKIYLTYNGGHVFDLRRTDEAADAPGAGADPGAPTDAPGLRRRAAAFAERGEFARALADLSRAIELQPDDAASFNQRAIIYWRMKDPEHAAEDLNRALELRPNDVAMTLNRGALRLSQGDDSGATADFDRVAALAPGDVEASLRVAEIYENYGHYQEAVTRLDRWIAANPHDERLPAVRAGRCWARALLGDGLPQATEDCEFALKHGQRVAKVLVARGIVYLRMRQFDKSVADFEDALKLQPRDAGALYGRGLAESDKGLRAAGQRDLQAATALDANEQSFYERMGLRTAD